MIKKGKMPITGTNKAMRPKPAVKTNAMTPSADAEKQIKQPPQPFANKFGTVNMPTKKQFESKGTDYAVEPGTAKDIRSGIRSKPVTVRGLPPGGPVGQTKPINQSGQVFGRMGTANPKKKGSFFPGTFKAKKNAAFYGDA